MKTDVHLWSYIAPFFLEWEMFQTNFVEKIETRVLYYAYCTVHHLDIWIKVDQLCWHLLYYVNLLLNMFRMLIHPSSGVCDYLMRYCVGCIVLTWGVLVLCSGIDCWWCGIRVQAEPLQSSRKLLKMDVLTSETCWAVHWHNKAIVIKVGLPLFKHVFYI